MSKLMERCVGRALCVQVEPESDAEREAKFQLYETLLESVEGEWEGSWAMRTYARIIE